MTIIVSHRALGIMYTKQSLSQFEPDSYLGVNVEDNCYSAIDEFVSSKKWRDCCADFVEIDVWLPPNGDLWVGHDECEFLLPIQWLKCKRLIVHCKNAGAVDWLSRPPVKISCDWFYHENDNMTITKLGKIWVHPQMVINNPKEIPPKSYVVLPTMEPNKLFRYVSSEMMKTWEAVVTNFPIEMGVMLNGQ